MADLNQEDSNTWHAALERIMSIIHDLDFFANSPRFEWQDAYQSLQTWRTSAERRIAQLVSRDEADTFHRVPHLSAFSSKQDNEGKVKKLIKANRDYLEALYQDISRDPELVLGKPARKLSKSSKPKESDEASSTTFNVHVHGGTNNLAIGTGPITQSTEFGITPKDFGALAALLRSKHIAEEDISELKEAIESDPPATKEGFGKKVSSWIWKMIGKAATGAWNVAQAAGTELLTKALLAYYGLPPT